jgi:predicted PhzF superfamily epimerase YddE/YHI9
MSTAGIPLSIVDAFTEVAFAGNPAAVCRLDAWPDDGWLQQVAAEMNLAETAFVVPRAVPGEFDLRWFTPQVEVDLCGHATLASTHVLGVDGEVVFHTRSGELRCSRRDGRIEMDFPAIASRPVGLDPQLVEALGSQVRSTATGSFLLAELGSAAAVRELRPDVDALRAVHTHGVIVTATGEPGGADIVSRVFAPNLGIDEDPVTGSAHCQLAPWWAARLGRTDVRAEQASARGGLLTLRLVGDRVTIIGSAVTVVEGRLRTPLPTLSR